MRYTSTFTTGALLLDETVVLLQNGALEEEMPQDLQVLLGHADISTTMRYAHLAPKAFQDELQRVFG